MIRDGIQVLTVLMIYAIIYLICKSDKDNRDWLLIVLILFSTMFDGWRDAWINREAGVGNIEWHLVKWMSFYVPLVYLWYRLRYSIKKFVLPIVALGVWKLGFFIGNAFQK